MTATVLFWEAQAYGWCGQRAVIIAICALIIAPVLFNGIATEPTADDIYFANKINEYATSNSAVHEVPVWTRFSAATSLHTPFLFLTSSTYPFIVICIAYLAIRIAFALPLAWGLGNVGPLRAHGQIILMLLLLLPLFYHSVAILITRNVWPFLTRTVKKIAA